MSDFRSWQEKDVKPKEKATKGELLKAANELLESDELNLIGDFERKYHARRLRASVLLHRLRELPGPSPQKGEALNLLGPLYNRLQHHLFFWFNQMYLRTCIQDYPKTKIAKDCYNSLERVLLDGYTGSGGAHLPSDAEVELFQLKRLAC